MGSMRGVCVALCSAIDPVVSAVCAIGSVLCGVMCADHTHCTIILACNIVCLIFSLTSKKILTCKNKLIMYIY